jgi:hypothetical protein
MAWPLIRAAGVVVPMWREIAEMAYLWRVPHALDGTALRRVAGPLVQTPLEQALLREFRAPGCRDHDSPEAVRLGRYGEDDSSRDPAAADP